MDASAISKIIADDLAAAGLLQSTDIHSRLVAPRKVRTEDGFNPGQFKDFWLVYRESPDANQGCLVIFDEEQETFGLCVEERGAPVFIGWYGSFTETLLEI